MSSIAAIEEEKKQYQEQLEIVHSQLRDDPENAELRSLKEELNNLVDLLNENIAELQPKQAAVAKKQQPSPPSPPQQQEPAKWSRENHPAFKKSAPSAAGPAASSAAAAAPPAEEDAPVNYQVNDTVLAKWVSGDRQFYPARITSITGSSTAPIYIVKFKSYDNTETLRSRDIKPVSNKRKADGPPNTSTSATTTPPLSGNAAAGAPPPPPSAPGVVTSAGATRYPDAANAGESADQAGKPPKPKKIKAKKELEAGKNKWQEFNSKSKFGKSQKKDSMFRTPDGVHGRVGFTGSGQSMRKDPTRSRHVYQVNEELD